MLPGLVFGTTQARSWLSHGYSFVDLDRRHYEKLQSVIEGSRVVTSLL